MSAHNLVDFLDTHDAAALTALRGAYPAAEDLLRWDRTLGDEETVVDPGIAPRRALAEAGAATLQVRGEVILKALSQRLRQSQRLKTGSALLAALANVGLLASLGLGARTVQVLLAVVAFCASSFGVLGERAGSTRASQLFDAAVAASTRLMRCEQTRRRLELGSVGPGAWDGLLEELDTVARELHEIETKARVA